MRDCALSGVSSGTGGAFTAALGDDIEFPVAFGINFFLDC
jgi:hypothetical protein